MNDTPQVAHWCFTSYENEAPPYVAEKMKYMVFQIERCPDTQRLHFQGYVEFARSYKMQTVKNLLGSNTIHVEPRRKERHEAREYCMKEDTRIDGPFEFGIWNDKSQGRRSDLQDVSKSIKEGKSFRKICEDHTDAAIKYHKGIKAVIKTLNNKERDPNLYNVILWGDTRCGKSTFAYKRWPKAYRDYITSWWENYEGEEEAIYDEFDGRDHMDSSLLKKITHKFDVSVPYKGDSTRYYARTNIFTSNVNPRDWYPREHWEPIKGRMTHIIYCQKQGEERFYQCEICVGDCELVNEIKEFFN